MGSNLDIICAEYANKFAEIPKNSEKIINNLLSVVETQGLYAMFIFAKSQYSGKKDQILWDEIENISKDLLTKIDPNINNTTILESIKKISEDLDKLLFIRSLFIKALVYARYFIKIQTTDTGVN